MSLAGLKTGSKACMLIAPCVHVCQQQRYTLMHCLPWALVQWRWTADPADEQPGTHLHGCHHVILRDGMQSDHLAREGICYAFDRLAGLHWAPCGPPGHCGFYGHDQHCGGSLQGWQTGDCHVGGVRGVEEVGAHLADQGT